LRDAGGYGFHAKTHFGCEPGLHISQTIFHSVAFLGFGCHQGVEKNKKPAIDWQSRALEILLCYRLEHSSHVAMQSAILAPDAHRARANRGANYMFKRDVHGVQT
jgi:hypothetical protein